ncbi:MAG: arylsulfatase [Chloroflexota bacterium]|nr:arylsulfatase [Chloroflexota bacterium]
MTRPNILLILADDMGYSDLGCYGSEIRTPNLDGLAASGLRFSQMYNSARCCPSRASLLTGLNPHQTGVGHMMDALGPPEYQGYLNRNCATVAEVLRSAGYATYMSGKWHVGGRYDLLDDSRWEELKGSEGFPIPTQRGFDRFYGIVAGSANYFFPRLLMEDDRFLELDPAGYYFTDAITDNAVKMLDENAAANSRASANGDAEKPFFLHVTYTAPHWPLHAHEEDIARYEGKYRGGWDTLRTDRHEELKASGILSDKWQISPRNASATAWEDEGEKDWEDLKMATYAAMIDRMDQGIGRIMDKVREMDAEDNTLVMFLSDNGGCAEFLAEDSNRPEPSQYASPNPDGTPVKMGNILGQRPGPGDTFMSYSLPWANASNSPFRLFKRWTHEGGISTPFIVSWPERIKQAGIVHEPTHISDIPATCIDAGGATYPTELNGNDITPIEGVSFMDAIDNGEWKRDLPIYWEHEGSRALRIDNWKLVAEVGGEWELYDMDDDRTELNNLVESNAPKAAEMIALYESWAERCGVQPWPLTGRARMMHLRAPHNHYV